MFIYFNIRDFVISKSRSFYISSSSQILTSTLLWASNSPSAGWYCAITHIAQNIAETCQKYFQSFIAIEILPQNFCKLFQNISLQY